MLALVLRIKIVTDFIDVLFREHYALMGFIIGGLIVAYQRLGAINRTLQRIEILLQEAAREADRIIVKTGHRPPQNDLFP